MKNNYPIKYVVMKVIEQTGWIHVLNGLELNLNDKIMAEKLKI